MPDYKELYLKMFRASEEAANVLISVRQECERFYVNAPESELIVVALPPENEKNTDDE
jgi:hypothetical protein